MNDEYIKKEEAMDECNKRGAEHIADAIKAIPLADVVERKRGEWVVHEARTTVGESGIDFYPAEYECSCCGFKESMYFIDREPYNFCPNCGARMKGAEDED